MKAVVVSTDKYELRVGYPMPMRRAGEALVKVTVVGVCGTDLELLHGKLDFYGVPGHEFVGTVEDADATDLIGRRVVGEINCPCGHCQLCRLGLWRHCRSRTILGLWKRDGAFAEFLTLPEGNLHLVPDDMSDETAVFVEPTAAAYDVLRRLDPARGDRVLVIGDGKLGLISSQVLATRCDVTVLGNVPSKLAIAKKLGHATAMVGSFKEKDFDITIEASGTPEGFTEGLNLLRPMGRLVLKTTIGGETPVRLWKIANNEITVIGSRCGPFQPALRALRDGDILVEPLISARFALDDFEAAIAKAAEPECLKVLVYPGGVP
jgi:threonine dehydrogenase-like Zn-dependent dehydrogenase